MLQAWLHPLTRLDHSLLCLMTISICFFSPGQIVSLKKPSFCLQRLPRFVYSVTTQVKVKFSFGKQHVFTNHSVNGTPTQQLKSMTPFQTRHMRPLCLINIFQSLALTHQGISCNKMIDNRVGAQKIQFSLLKVIRIPEAMMEVSKST